MGARERLPVEQDYVRDRGGGRAPRGAAVGARERMSVGRGRVPGCGVERAPRGADSHAHLYPTFRAGVKQIKLRDGDEICFSGFRVSRPFDDLDLRRRAWPLAFLFQIPNVSLLDNFLLRG